MFFDATNRKGIHYGDDFVEQVRYRQRAFVPPVQSRLDIDFYKFTMGQVSSVTSVTWR